MAGSQRAVPSLWPCRHSGVLFILALQPNSASGVPSVGELQVGSLCLAVGAQACREPLGSPLFLCSVSTWAISFFRMGPEHE